MADEIVLDNSSLTEKMIDVLESWPLYRVLEFKGTVLGYNGAETVIDFPVELKLDCTHCNNNQRWRSNLAALVDGKYRFTSKAGFYWRYHTLTYTCKNCSS